MTVKQLIDNLKRIEKKYGNIEISHYSDQEGNVESELMLYALSNGISVYRIVCMPK